MTVRAFAPTRKTATPTSTSVPSGVLQRQCACGTHTIAGGDCDGCRDDKGTLRRRSSGLAQPSTVPSIVYEVLRSPGQPLDVAMRSEMEPRFRHDFSQVRLHTGTKAAASAQAVNALAYTVGSNVVWGAGQFAPETGSGRQLLAHELAHVVQQAGVAPAPQGSLVVGQPGSAAESEAERAAHGMASGPVPHSVDPDQLVLRRKDDPAQTPGTKHAGRKLEDLEVTQVKNFLTAAKVSIGTPLAKASATQFVLHDTAAPVTKSAIERHEKLSHGLLDVGENAYVSREGLATIIRPEFFNPRRPTATEYEKALAEFQKPEDQKLKTVAEKVKTWTQRRDDALRTVWNAASPEKQAAAFKAAVAELTPEESASEQEGTPSKKGIPSKKASFDNQMKIGSKETIWTAGLWAVEEICQSPPEGAKAACATLAPSFSARQARLGTTVNVEIVQPGVISLTDKEKREKLQAAEEQREVKEVKVITNSCDPRNPDLVPLDKPPYSKNQYAQVTALYLRAALMAKKFPTITTHYAVDKSTGDHCDPRCFNLHYLYKSIAQVMAHEASSTYGIEPLYGRGPKANVWWDKERCYGPPPG